MKPVKDNSDALDTLFKESYQKAYRAAKCICFDGGMAEDVVAEALLRMWKTLKSGRNLDNAEAFFLRVTVNEAKRLALRRSDIPSDKIADYLDELIMCHDETLMYAEEAKRLLFAVNSLPVKLALPVKLHYYGGFSEKEASKMLGVSYAAIKTRLHRARQKLKECLLGENGNYGGRCNET